MSANKGKNPDTCVPENTVLKTTGCRFNDAIIYAAEKHAGQKRKGSDTPYIVHPLEVMQILRQMNADEDLLIAGLLHDCVEDTDATAEEIEAIFGADVRRLVADHTEDKSKSWEERKQTALEEARHADTRLQMLILADKLSNLRSVRDDIRRPGVEETAFWQRFNRPREKQAWVYTAAADALAEIEKTGTPGAAAAYREYRQLLTEVFKD